MKIDISGQNLDTGESFRDYAENNLKKSIDKYFERAIAGSVILKKSLNNFSVKIIVTLTRRTKLETSGSSSDAHAAFDIALEKAEKRLRRYKRRLKDYRSKGDKKELIFAQETVLDSKDDLEEEMINEDGMPPVLMELSYNIEEMTTEEAIMKFDLENLNALMYRNISHQGLNMLYRRNDGAIGWVDPRGHRDHTVSKINL
tara:strand:+ start:726 stop:1328 length:603 start_codon:yes stop_codon:yes gene_type:complete